MEELKLREAEVRTHTHAHTHTQDLLRVSQDFIGGVYVKLTFHVFRVVI